MHENTAESTNLKKKSAKVYIHCSMLIFSTNNAPWSAQKVPDCTIVFKKFPDPLAQLLIHMHKGLTTPMQNTVR